MCGFGQEMGGMYLMSWFFTKCFVQCLYSLRQASTEEYLEKIIRGAGITVYLSKEKQEIKEAFELFDTDGSGMRFNFICLFLIYSKKILIKLVDPFFLFSLGTIDAKELNIAMRYRGAEQVVLLLLDSF